jgi:hypothetical protein
VLSSGCRHQAEYHSSCDVCVCIHMPQLLLGMVHFYLARPSVSQCCLHSCLQDGPPLYLNSISWRGVAPSAGAIGWPYITGKRTTAWIRDQQPSIHAMSIPL